MMRRVWNKVPALQITLLGAVAFSAVGEAHAADRFKVTRVDCEMFWYSKHTPVINYDITDGHRTDYNTNPSADYFREAAVRTREYCDRTSYKPQQLLGPPRQIFGIWFQSNDGQFKALYDLSNDRYGTFGGIVNRIGDRYTDDQRTLAQKVEAERRHQAQLDEIRTRDARAKQVKDAEEKLKQDRNNAEYAREKAFFERQDLQISRLGTEVIPANFTNMNDVRTNPFHFRKLGLAIVRTQFNKMVSDKIALFGNEFAPIFVHIEDVDRFTRAGETVMLALKVTERGEVERSYGSLPEIIISSVKADPIYGEYVGSYTCPDNDCGRIFDVPPPS